LKSNGRRELRPGAVALSRSKKERFPSYDDFLKRTGGKKYDPVYLFVGQEDFLIEECVGAIIADLLTLDTKAFNLDIVYGSKVDARDVVAHAASFPMMSDRRVVVVREFEKLLSDEAAKDTIGRYLAKPLESTCLVLVAESPDFRTKPFNDLSKRGVVYACNPLYDNQIPAWIAQRCTSFGREADFDACQMLHAYVGNSLRAIQNELDKLFTYLGERKKIEVEDVADVVGAARGFTIFDLQGAIGKKNLDAALRIVRRMIESGETPQMMIAMLTKYLALLWKVQELLSRQASEVEIAALVKIPPYHLKNYTEAAPRFTQEQLTRSFTTLLRADLQLKSASPDPYQLMEMLVYSLIRDVRAEETAHA
jgi:DNA polymerase-3 subunit delta